MLCKMMFITFRLESILQLAKAVTSRVVGAADDRSTAMFDAWFKHNSMASGCGTNIQDAV